MSVRDASLLRTSSRAGDLMGVKVDSSNGFSIGRPETLLAGVLDRDAREPSFIVHSDGQHFVILRRGGAVEIAPPEIIVVRSWTEEVRRRVLANGRVDVTPCSVVEGVEFRTTIRRLALDRGGASSTAPRPPLLRPARRAPRP